MERNAALDEAVDRAGTQGALAAVLTKESGQKITQQSVSLWCKGAYPFPTELCPIVEERYGVTCERLRSDIRWYVVRGGAKKEVA